MIKSSLELFIGTNKYIFSRLEAKFNGRIRFPNCKISRFLPRISTQVYEISAGVGPLARVIERVTRAAIANDVLMHFVVVTQ